MSSPPDRPQAPPALAPFLALCVLASVLIDLGTFHRCQHADSLIFVPMSLYRWTPFYWDLDRVGMLVPLLARLFTNPLTNLLVQCGLYLSFGLTAFFLLARYLLRDATYPLVAAAGAASFLLLTPPYYRFEFFQATYGVWLTLGLGGLLCLEPRPDGSIPWGRRLLALFLLTLAHWVYCTTALFLGPLVVFRFVAFGRPRPAGAAASGRFPRLVAAVRAACSSESGLSLAVMGAAFAAGALFMVLSRQPHTRFGSLPMAEWPGSWQALLYRTWVNLAPQRWPAFLAASAGAGLLLLALPAVRGGASAALRAAFVPAAAAVTIGLFMGTREHVQLNLHMFRFLSPSVFFGQAACLILATLPLRALCGGRVPRPLLALSGPLLVLAALISYGLPSVGGVARDLSAVHAPTLTGIAPLDGVATDDLLDARCTHVAGDYWKVWPAVFNANRALHDRGEKRVVWGVTLRSGPTRRFWSKVPIGEMRIAVPVGDAQAEGFLRRNGFPPLTVVEKRPTAWIYRPRAAVVTTAGGG